MLMQGQEVVEASWQAVDECWICVRIVAMWSGCIRDGLCVHVSILGVVCTVTVVATHPQMATQTAGDSEATQTDGDSEGEDLRQERSLDTGLSGEQIALLMAEVKGLKKAVVERQNEMAKMIVKRTRERQHSFLRPGNQSQYDFTDAVLGQVQDALRDLEYGSTEETRGAAVHSLQKAAEMLERRMKLIKMADRSEYGWAVVAEYESDELAVDSDDEKRISRAEKEAEKKWLRKRKRQIDDRVDGARGVTGATQLRATSNVGATPRAGPCFGCGEWGHLKRSCPRSVRGAVLPAPVHIPPTMAVDPRPSLA
eukprot:Em0003g1268a